MKAKHIIPVVSLLPLVIVAIFAIFGVVLDFRVYLILAIVCPVVAGFLLFTIKSLDKKLSDAGKPR